MCHSGVHVSGSQRKPGFAVVIPLFYRWVKVTQRVNGKPWTQTTEMCGQRSFSGTTLSLHVWILIPTLFSLQIQTKVEMEKREICQMTSTHTTGAYLKPELTEISQVSPAIWKHLGVLQIYNTEMKIVVISLMTANTTCLINQYKRGNLNHLCKQPTCSNSFSPLQCIYYSSRKDHSLYEKMELYSQKKPW